jgi:hypothetical protein
LAFAALKLVLAVQVGVFWWRAHGSEGLFNMVFGCFQAKNTLPPSTWVFAAAGIVDGSLVSLQAGSFGAVQLGCMLDSAS